MDVQCCHYRRETKGANLHEHGHEKSKEAPSPQQTPCGNDTRDPTQSTRSGHGSWISPDWPGRRFTACWYIPDTRRSTSIQGSVLQASPGTELFHDRVRAAPADLPGCTYIDDNILVW